MNSTCPLLKVHFDYEDVCMTYLFFLRTNLFLPQFCMELLPPGFLTYLFVSFVIHRLIYSP